MLGAAEWRLVVGARIRWIRGGGGEKDVGFHLVGNVPRKIKATIIWETGWRLVP